MWKRGTSFIRKCPTLGSHSWSIPRALQQSGGEGGRFLISEVPLEVGVMGNGSNRLSQAVGGDLVSLNGRRTWELQSPHEVGHPVSACCPRQRKAGEAQERDNDQCQIASVWIPLKCPACQI